MTTAIKRLRKYLGIVTTLALTTCGVAHSETTKISQFVASTAELHHNIDAKTAKQGETVTAGLTKSVHITGGIELPRKTQLVGHIDEVQPSENKGLSKIILTFDQARLANGQQVFIKSTIVGIYPAGSESVLPPTLSAELKVDQELPGKHGFALNSSVADAQIILASRREASLQRLFTTFAEGWPGLGLLSQRLVTGIVPLHHGTALFKETPTAAGLPQPNLFSEIPIWGGADAPLSWLVDTLRSLLPQLHRMGIAMKDVLLIETLENQLRDAIVATQSQVSGPVQICAWARL
jgi:hypothetical protein